MNLMLSNPETSPVVLADSQYKEVCKLVERKFPELPDDETLSKVCVRDESVWIG